MQAAGVQDKLKMYQGTWATDWQICEWNSNWI